MAESRLYVFAYHCCLLNLGEGYKKECFLCVQFCLASCFIISRNVVVYWININNVLNVLFLAAKILFAPTNLSSFLVAATEKRFDEKGTKRLPTMIFKTIFSILHVAFCSTLIALKTRLLLRSSCWSEKVFLLSKNVINAIEECFEAQLYSSDSSISVQFHSWKQISFNCRHFFIRHV